MSVLYPRYGTSVMISTPHQQATQAAYQILENGGNAIDASIAAMAALTVVLPSKCSAAGDLAMIYWDQQSKTVHTQIASGPVASSIPAAYEEPLPDDSPFLLTAPAAVEGWWSAWQRFGSISFSELLRPAIRLAHEGFPVSPLLQATIQAHSKHLQPGDDRVVKSLLDIAYGRSTILRQLALAETYRGVAREGSAYMLHGPWANHFLDVTTSKGGKFRSVDLEKYRSEWSLPERGGYKGYTFYAPPAPSQGVSLLEMLSIMEHLELEKKTLHSSRWFHEILGAYSFVMHRRNDLLGDPRF